MELIIKEASHSSLIPPLENEAAMGIVPYIQRGDATPSIDANIIPMILLPSLFIPLIRL